MNNNLNEIGIENYIFLSVIHWVLVLRRNAIIVFMSIEIMLNAVNLLFVAFQPIIRIRTSCIFSLWLLPLPSSCGLAILVSIFRNLGSIDINKLKNLKDKL
jgi:NADH-quinone oxidoreductase subunit K